VGENYDKYEEDEKFIHESWKKEDVLKLELRYYDDIKKNFQKYDGVK
jgi:hypothetical protein